MALHQMLNLKIAHWLPLSHPIHSAIQEWARSIESASDGTITTAIYPEEQLGRGPDHYNLVLSGAADIALCVPGYQAQRFPLATVVDQPFTSSDAKAGSLAFDQWYRPHAAREMADIRYCFTFLMGPGVIHSSHRIQSPSDVVGMRLRPPNTTIARMLTQLGAQTQQVALVDTPAAVRNGELDGVAVPWGGLSLFGFDAYFKFHLNIPLYTTAFTLALNRATYETMTDGQKAVMAAHSTASWAERFGDYWMGFERWGQAQLSQKSGHEIVTLSPQEFLAWRDAATGVKREWAERVRLAGSDPEKVWADFTVHMARFETPI